MDRFQEVVNVAVQVALPSVVTQLSTLLGGAGPQATTTAPSGSGRFLSQGSELQAQTQHPLTDAGDCAALSSLAGANIPLTQETEVWQGPPILSSLVGVGRPIAIQAAPSSLAGVVDRSRGTWIPGHMVPGLTTG